MIAPSPELVERFGSLSAATAGALDAASIDAGIGTDRLMETAGWQVARCVNSLARYNAAGIVVIAGSGNNGGDALVAARHLRCWGWAVDVIVLSELGTWRLRHLAEPLTRLGVRVGGDPTGDTACAALRGAGNAVVVDGLLGTGLSETPRPEQARVIEAMAGATVVSIDVPSGLDATTGEAFSPTVRARRTCTLGAMKSGLWSDAARECAGEIWVADIGIPQAAWHSVGRNCPSAITGGELLPLPSDT